MSAARRYSCLELGVCQGRTPGCDCCEGAPRAVTMYGPCTHDCSQGDACTCALPVSADVVQAARDSGCFVPFAGFEPPQGRAAQAWALAGRALYRVAVVCGSVGLVALVFGLLGYASARHGGLI